MKDENISKTDKNRIVRIENIDSMFVMLGLVNSSHTEYIQAFPKELILAIAWEESYFQNIAQFGGPAAGYGQLEISGRRIANQHWTGDVGAGEGIFSRAAILNSRQTSILAMSHCLAGLYERLNYSTEAVLKAYAGVRYRPQNAPIPGRWQQCATELRNILVGDPLRFNFMAVEKALRLAKNFDESGPVYDHIHSKLWPILEIIEKIVNQVQYGSKGYQVMALQDTMNRFSLTESLGGLSSPLLAVDGQFGPKTHARVKQFQTNNSLVSDGVVGPHTRSVMLLKAQAMSLS